MNAEQFVTYLQDESHLYSLNYQEFKGLALKYPYCQNLRFLVLKKSQLAAIPEKEQEENLQLAAAYLTDRRFLYQKLKRLREQPPLPLAQLSEIPLFELTALSEIEQKRLEPLDALPPLPTFATQHAEAFINHSPPLSKAWVADEIELEILPICLENNPIENMNESTQNIDNQENNIVTNQENDDDLNAILAILGEQNADSSLPENGQETDIDNLNNIEFTSEKEHWAIVAANLDESWAQDLEEVQPQNAPSTPDEIQDEPPQIPHEIETSESLTVADPPPVVETVATEYEEDLEVEPPILLPPKPEFSRLELSDFTEKLLEEEYKNAAQQLAAQQAKKKFDEKLVITVDLQQIALPESENNNKALEWEITPPSVTASSEAPKKISFNNWLTQLGGSPKKATKKNID